MLILGANKFEFLVSLYAVWFAGKTAVIIHEQSTSEELETIRDIWECDTIIISQASRYDDIDVKNIKK